MARWWVLLALTFAGSALWWPALCVEPNLELPVWIPIACCSAFTFIATTLSPKYWAAYALASGAGTVTGLKVSYSIWLPSDPVSGPWVGIGIIVSSVVVAIASFVAAGVGRRVNLRERSRRALLRLLPMLVLSGPVALALTAPLVANRVESNDKAAAERFASLKVAVGRAWVEGGSPGVCDGMTVKRYYSGRPFPDEDWRRMAGNVVFQDGYGFMIHCRERGGYALHAAPVAQPKYDTRLFCSNETGVTGCGLDFGGSRWDCLPCPR